MLDFTRLAEDWGLLTITSGRPRKREQHGYFARLRAASAPRDSLLCIGPRSDPRVIGGGIDEALEHCRRGYTRVPALRRQGWAWRPPVRSLRWAGRGVSATPFGTMCQGFYARNERGV